MQLVVALRAQNYTIIDWYQLNRLEIDRGFDNGRPDETVWKSTHQVAVRMQAIDGV